MSAPPRPGGPGRGFPLRIGTVLKRTGWMWAVRLLENHFLRARFLVASDVRSAIAFCRTAPSVRPSLRPICLAGVFFFASDLSSRISFAVQPRRFPFSSLPSVISSPYSVICAARSRYFLKAPQELLTSPTFRHTTGGTRDGQTGVNETVPAVANGGFGDTTGTVPFGLGKAGGWITRRT